MNFHTVSPPFLQLLQPFKQVVVTSTCDLLSLSPFFFLSLNLILLSLVLTANCLLLCSDCLFLSSFLSHLSCSSHSGELLMFSPDNGLPVLTNTVCGKVTYCRSDAKSINQTAFLWSSADSALLSCLPSIFNTVAVGVPHPLQERTQSVGTFCFCWTPDFFLLLPPGLRPDLQRPTCRLLRLLVFLPSLHFTSLLASRIGSSCCCCL